MSTLRNALLAGLGNHLLSAMAMSDGNSKEIALLNRIEAEIDNPYLSKLLLDSLKMSYYINPKLNHAIILLLSAGTSISNEMIHQLANSGEYEIYDDKEVWDTFAELLPNDRKLIEDTVAMIDHITVTA